MEEVCCDWVLFLGVPGVCLDEYLNNQTPLCSSVRAEYLRGIAAGTMSPWYSNWQEQCASICSADMLCVLSQVRETISLAIR